MTEQTKQKKLSPPEFILPNKQVMPLIGYGSFTNQDQETLTEIFRRGLAIGYCRHIDTARYYNNQIQLGKAIKNVIGEDRVKRKDLFIATKTFNHKKLDPQLELKQALRLMQLTYVDLYYVHWPITDMTADGKEWTHRPLKQFWADMEKCVKKGYTKHLGLSNFNCQLINEVLAICTIPPVALQIEVHPYFQNDALIEFAKKKNIAVVAHTPLARAAQLSDEFNVFKDQLFLQFSKKYECSLGQAILKSTLCRGIGVIPGTTKPERVRENYECYKVDLSEEDMKKIKAIKKQIRLCDGRRLFRNFKVFEH